MDIDSLIEMLDARVDIINESLVSSSLDLTRETALLSEFISRHPKSNFSDAILDLKKIQRKMLDLYTERAAELSLRCALIRIKNKDQDEDSDSPDFEEFETRFGTLHPGGGAVTSGGTPVILDDEPVED